MSKEKLIPLEWHTEQRVIDSLIPWEKNPRQMKKKEVEDLKESLKRLNVIDIPSIDLDETLIGGHQRCKVLQLLGRGKETIDVRVPNRKLTEDEFKEANIRLNLNSAGWDADMLSSFDTEFLLDVGFTDKNLSDMFQLNMNFDEGPPPGVEPPVIREKKKKKCPECGCEF